MVKNKRYQCPKCARKFELVEESNFPFCSSRCKLIDLSHWLNEDYGLPYEDADACDVQIDNQANVNHYDE